MVRAIKLEFDPGPLQLVSAWDGETWITTTTQKAWKRGYLIRPGDVPKASDPPSLFVTVFAPQEGHEACEALRNSNLVFPWSSVGPRHIQGWIEEARALREAERARELLNQRAAEAFVAPKDSIDEQAARGEITPSAWVAARITADARAAAVERFRITPELTAAVGRFMRGEDDALDEQNSSVSELVLAPKKRQSLTMAVTETLKHSLTTAAVLAVSDRVVDAVAASLARSGILPESLTKHPAFRPILGMVVPLCAKLALDAGVVPGLGEEREEKLAYFAEQASSAALIGTFYPVVQQVLKEVTPFIDQIALPEGDE